MDIIITTDDRCSGGGVGEGVALKVQASKGEFFGRSFVIFL
jgi:hypothetical protein